MTTEAKAARGSGGKFLKKDAAQAAEPGFEHGGFVWAMAHVRRGKTVKRRSWVGAKSVSADHASGRVILENADIVADDWEVV